MLVGIAPMAKAPATAQSMWPIAQCVASVGTARAADDRRARAGGLRIRSPKTNKYMGTSKKPPPLASSPVNNPTPADAATSRRRFLRRTVPAERVDCSIGRSTRCPTTMRTRPEAMSGSGPPTSSDSKAPIAAAGNAPTSVHAAAPRPGLPSSDVGTAAPRAAGMVAGGGKATARSPGTPRTASNGVAVEEPPTPNSPSRCDQQPPRRRRPAMVPSDRHRRHRLDIKRDRAEDTSA